jgi:hypothetical protein
MVGESACALHCIVERASPASVEQRSSGRAQAPPLVGVGRNRPDFFDDDVQQGTLPARNTPVEYNFQQCRLKGSLTASMKVRPCAALTHSPGQHRHLSRAPFAFWGCVAATSRPNRPVCELAHTRGSQLAVERHPSVADAYVILASTILTAPAFRRGFFICRTVNRRRCSPSGDRPMAEPSSTARESRPRPLLSGNWRVVLAGSAATLGGQGLQQNDECG